MSRRAIILAVTTGFTLALASVSLVPADADPSESRKILRIDHGVPHTLTVPSGVLPDPFDRQVLLFVREVRADNGTNDDEDYRSPAAGSKVVLFVHGGTTPSVPAFDLQFKDYSWAEFLARAGFDVFMMDHTGYGFSPRPMMTDPCNTSSTDQAALIPNPLAAPCSPSYPFLLTTNQSDWDEVHTVVEYIKALRGVERANLVGWSFGGRRVGGYAARHPENVEKLILLAPTYNPLAPSVLPPPLPRAGSPMSLQSHRQLINERWDPEVQCQNQFDQEIRPVVWNTIMAFDPLGSTWGTPAWNPIASATGGQMRSPRFNPAFGWNKIFAGQIEAPSLIVVGQFDGLAPGNPGPIPARNLYDDLATQNKVRIEVACASHPLVWENQHRVLLEASKAWFLHGSIEGVHQGILCVDADGRFTTC